MFGGRELDVSFVCWACVVLVLVLCATESGCLCVPLLIDVVLSYESALNA